MRQTLLELLQERCDIVGSVADGKAVLQEVETSKPDVVLLGVSFDGTSGFEIARCLRNGGCKPKVIFVSLYESEELVHAALAKGASGYVFMSRLLDDLPAAIDAVCRGAVFLPVMKH